MMESLGLTVLLLIACSQGAMGADKGLGEKCTSGDTCTSTPASVCDDVVKRCLIKQGEDCSGTSFAKMCVSGAECTSNTCTCKTSVYTADTNTGKCTSSGGKWGLTCTASGNECTGTGVRCVTDVCVCDDDKAVDLATGDCTGTIGNERVGKKCTNADKDTTCGAATTNLECPASGGVCDCAADYFGPLAGVCSPAPGKIKGGCSADGDCDGNNVECTTNVCACKTGYTTNGLHGCTKGLGEACTTNTDCDGTTATCDEFSKKCLLKTNQDCNSDAKKDKCVTGASCDTEGSSPSNNCKCITNVYTDTSNICYATTAGKATGACKATDPKCDDANAECVSSRCKCKSGYKLKDADATCEKGGAITVMTSAMTVMLAAVSGRLFTLN